MQGTFDIQFVILIIGNTATLSVGNQCHLISISAALQHMAQHCCRLTATDFIDGSLFCGFSIGLVVPYRFYFITAYRCCLCIYTRICIRYRIRILMYCCTEFLIRLISQTIFCRCRIVQRIRGQCIFLLRISNGYGCRSILTFRNGKRFFCKIGILYGGYISILCSRNQKVYTVHRFYFFIIEVKYLYLYSVRCFQACFYCL